jgi:Resolvase, N terminal domain
LATPRIPLEPSAVIVGLARQAALKAVKQELRDLGRRLSRFTARDLKMMANDYLAQHREALIAETWQRLQSSSTLRAFYEREERDHQRQLKRNLKDLHSSKTADPKRELAVQNSCAKWRAKVIVGYARVSTDGQSLESQQAALAQAGAEKVFAEKMSVSGAVTVRKALARAIAELGPGDCFVVTRLDRLARSTTKDLLNTLDAIAKAGAGFRSLADAWADTTIRMGD